MKKAFFVSALLFSTALGQDMAEPFVISAPTDTEIKLLTLSTVKIEISDIQVNAVSGSSVSKEELQKMQQELSKGLGKADQTITTKGTMLQKVIKRDNSGQITLQVDLTQETPDRPKINFNIQQEIDSKGKIKNIKIQSDDPQLKKVFEKMNLKDMEAFVDSAGANLSNFYGIQYTKDQPVENEVTVDAQSMLGDMVTAIAGQPKIQMTPMKVTTSQIYRGLDEQGLHKFDLKTGFKSWNFRIPSQQPDQPVIDTELINAETTGHALYYKNGLMAGADQEMKMSMKMTILDKKYKISMVMNMTNQTKQLSATEQ